MTQGYIQTKFQNISFKIVTCRRGTDKQTNRQTNRLTNILAKTLVFASNKQTDRQTDRPTYLRKTQFSQVTNQHMDRMTDEHTWRTLVRQVTNKQENATDQYTWPNRRFGQVINKRLAKHNLLGGGNYRKIH